MEHAVAVAVEEEEAEGMQKGRKRKSACVAHTSEREWESQADAMHEYITREER